VGLVGDVLVLVPDQARAAAVGPDAVVTGSGAVAVGTAVAQLRPSVPPGAPVAVAGPAEPLDPALQPGQLVVATEIWAVRTDGDAPVVEQVRRLPSALLLAAELRRDGHRVAVGPIATVGPLPADAAFDGAGEDRELRAVLSARGALTVDRESAWAAALAGDDRPLAVVRSVEGASDQDAPLVASRHDGAAAGTVDGIRPALDRWARACQARQVVLAAPRSFCAGVERAIEIVERALERFGAPVYVRRQIVHNAHVVGRLAAMGAVFVEELDEVPDGATVVLAAHGVSPEVRSQAAGRDGFTVIDATCPLVAKVHHEAKRYAARGFDIVLIGHADHEEIVGTLGEAPDRTHLVESPADVEHLAFEDGAPVAYLTQTTLATDETAEVIDALRRRFPDIAGPSADDICYATQNRQDAVRAIARSCDLILVVGSANSSNTARLVEVARREGCRAELVEDAGQLRLSWLDGAGTVGLTAGASAPESLVDELVQALSSLGPVAVAEHRTTTETVRFALPLQVR
jgi:4-hydroxy-3-methylbut-2-en-1-yl diphosphate reductase